MDDMTMLPEVKTRLGITGDYQDALLSRYITDVEAYLEDAGADKQDIDPGIVTRGVIDLWNFGQGSVGFSEYFTQRAVQLLSKEGGEEEGEGKEGKGGEGSG
jgi:hypothetical protein